MSQFWAPGSSEPQPLFKPFRAIWDTGATNSVITQSIVDACGLVPIGMTRVSHVDGEGDAEVYLVNIGLPDNVTFYGVRVTKGRLKDADMLIGMSIINRGDFAVTNYNGITKFSFRVPSVGHIDFVADTPRPQFQHGGKPNPKRPNLSGGGKQGKKKRKR